MPEEKLYKGILDPRCKAYEHGKSTKPIASAYSQKRTNRPMERIYRDLIGPMPKKWLGKPYILTIIDYFSQFCQQSL